MPTLLFMALAAAVPGRLLPGRHGHETLAVLALAGVCFGTVEACRCCLLGPLIDSGRRRRWAAAALVAVAVLPIALAGVTQAYLFFSRPELPWVGLSWRARHIPVYLSFACWEWLTCLVLSVYMLALTGATRRAAPGGAPDRLHTPLLSSGGHEEEEDRSWPR